MLRRWYGSWWVASLLILCLSLALLLLRLLDPPARLVDLGAPGDAYLVSNFYQPEPTAALDFRWSGPSSALQLPAFVTRDLFLRVRLHGNHSGQTLALTVNDPAHPLALFPVDQGWRVYHALLRSPVPLTMPGGGRIALQTDLSKPAADDPRELGVAVDWVWLQPYSGSRSWLWAARYATLLIWAMLCVAGALWIAIRAWAVATPMTQRWPWISAGMAWLGVALALWAWADLYSMVWLLPLQPAGLALTSLLLMALALLAWKLPQLAWFQRNGRHGEVIIVIALLTLAHLVLWSSLPAAWRGGAALLILWAPGWLLSRRLSADEPDAAARLLLGICGALGLSLLLLLAGTLLPFHPGPSGLLLACDLLALGGAMLLWLCPPGSPAPPHDEPQPLVLLGLILLLAAGLRLPFLGSAELHDDEASVLIAAAQLVQGQAEVLLTQLKGPVQVLLPAGPLALSGQLPELIARLPFALAGLGVVLGGFVLMRSLTGNGLVGLFAALGLALDGFMIAFARIVQYQSVVILMLLGALWCAWRFAAGATAVRRLLTGAAVLFAFGLLGHYDAIFAAPALAWLVLLGAWRRRWQPIDWVASLAWPLLVGGVLLASFYLPFVLHPHFAEAVTHLGERTGQAGASGSFYNNLAGTYALLSFYNLAGVIWLLALLLIGGLTVHLLRFVRPPFLAGMYVLLVAGAALDVLRGPDEALVLSRSPLAVLVLMLPITALILAPRTPAGLRVLLLWFGTGSLAMLFLVAQPRTHVYVAAVPALLLAGWAAAGLSKWLRQARVKPLHQPLAGSVGLLLLLGLLHQATLYVRQQPEYQRAYPATRLLPLAWGTAATTIDQQARFGFPSRDGWKAIGELYRRGELSGPFASNQSTEVIAWYTRGLQRCGATPVRYLIALAGTNVALPRGYYRAGMVQVEGENRIGIYAQTPPDGPQRSISLEDYRAAFDEQPILPWPTDDCPSATLPGGDRQARGYPGEDIQLAELGGSEFACEHTYKTGHSR